MWIIVWKPDIITVRIPFHCANERKFFRRHFVRRNFPIYECMPNGLRIVDFECFGLNLEPTYPLVVGPFKTHYPFRLPGDSERFSGLRHRKMIPQSNLPWIQFTVQFDSQQERKKWLGWGVGGGGRGGERDLFPWQFAFRIGTSKLCATSREQRLLTTRKKVKVATYDSIKFSYVFFVFKYPTQPHIWIWFSLHLWLLAGPYCFLFVFFFFFFFLFFYIYIE